MLFYQRRGVQYDLESVLESLETTDEIMNEPKKDVDMDSSLDLMQDSDVSHDLSLDGFDEITKIAPVEDVTRQNSPVPQAYEPIPFSMDQGDIHSVGYSFGAKTEDM